jgi:hypothetical protein
MRPSKPSVEGKPKVKSWIGPNAMVSTPLWGPPGPVVVAFLPPVGRTTRCAAVSLR